MLASFGINLLGIPVSSLVGAVSHRKNINWRLAPYIFIGGAFGSILGAFLAGLIPVLMLSIIFVIISVITVFGIYFDRISPTLAQKINPKAKYIMLGTFFINLLTGMRGGSGGSLFPPFLRMMRLDIHAAIATSLFVTIFTASAGGIIYWYRGDIILFPTLMVIIGSIIGSRLGSVLSLKTKPGWLEIGLSIFVIILALITVCKTLHYL